MGTIADAMTVAVGSLQAGRLQDAEDVCRQILAVDRNSAEAWHLFGVIALQAGQPALASERALRAVSLNPRDSEAQNTLGTALRLQQKWEEAIAHFRRAAKLRPDFAEAHYNLGYALQETGKLADAIRCFERVLKLKPDLAQAHSNLGSCLQLQGKCEDAIPFYRRALELNPALAETHNRLGTALQMLWQPDEAVACFQQAIRLNPAHAEAFNNLGTALKDQAKLDEAIWSYQQALALQPGFARAHSNLVYTLYFSPKYDAAAIYQEHLRWSDQQQATKFANSFQPHTNDRSPNRRLRIGYVSPDFRNHSQSYFTTPLFSSHDRENFEIFCYSDVTCPDAITARLRTLTQSWRDVAALSDEDVAKAVNADKVDILVDLTMHMARGRPFVFARKPAPVQVCWLAYPGTTGLPTMDCRLTDPHLDPPGLFDQYYSEQSIRLPDCFWCYDPLTDKPDVRELPAITAGHITFGSLNNYCKVNESVFQLWANALKAVNGSRLLLLSPLGSHRETALKLFEQEGVNGSRITFVAPRPRSQYLELYQQIDLGLDTFPANGHTTSLDAFWMGVPVVTLVGQTAIGRGGVSLLRNVDLPELIADSPEQFLAIVAGLASDLPRLSHLRATLRGRLQRSPLMDAPRFARNIESAYRTMWKHWCNSN